MFEPFEVGAGAFFGVYPGDFVQHLPGFIGGVAMLDRTVCLGVARSARLVKVRLILIHYAGFTVGIRCIVVLVVILLHW